MVLMVMLFFMLFFVLILIMRVLMCTLGNAVIGLVFCIGRPDAPLLANPAQAHCAALVVQKAVFQRPVFIPGVLVVVLLLVVITVLMLAFLMVSVRIERRPAGNIVVVRAAVKAVEMQRN